MSVYITGMEVPTSCQNCFASDDESRFCKAAKKYIPMLGKPKFCPLVPVPEHGRLIDADEFIKQKTEQICENCDKRRGMIDGKLTERFVYAIGDAPCRACETGDMLGYVDDAPTIIHADPAEEGEG